MDKTKSKKKGLGRGLGSLLKLDDEPVESSKPAAKSPDKIDLKSPKSDIDPEMMIHKILVENLYPNSEQPRKVFNEEALVELTNSIKEQGIMQPIVATKKSANKFEIIAGERRWRAAQRCGLKEVPVILRKVDEQNKLELSIIENIQRDDLNPIEEGEAYLLLAQKYKLTQKDIAQKVGKDRATVANLIRITALASKIKDKVVEGKISLGHAKVLLSVEDKQMQIKLAEKVERLNLSVRATESMVKNALNPEAKEKTNKHEAAYRDIEDQLKRQFGTKVKIDEKSGKGKIELSFHTLGQFNGLIDKLLNQ
jgi:ParB family chromosome partitioning protein